MVVLANSANTCSEAAKETILNSYVTYNQMSKNDELLSSNDVDSKSSESSSYIPSAKPTKLKDISSIRHLERTWGRVEHCIGHGGGGRVNRGMSK